jgi:hypothetical protein
MSRTPLAEFLLPIRTHRRQRPRKKLRVVIWEYLKDLRATAKKLDSSLNWRDAAGGYLAVRMRSFGQIHLCKKFIGAGYFAHELQHFMIDYSEESECHPLDPKANERMAYLAGDLTAQFWSEYYKRFPPNAG